jgi:exonuclease III
VKLCEIITDFKKTYDSKGKKCTIFSQLISYITESNSVHKRIISAVIKTEFVSGRMSHTMLRGRWCDIIVLNIHAPTEDKIDDMKDRFYEELEHVFDKFPKYHIKILLGDFNAKVGKEDIFKPKIWNESLHEISNDNGVRVVNFAISKYVTVKSTMYLYEVHS